MFRYLHMTDCVIHNILYDYYWNIVLLQFAFLNNRYRVSHSRALSIVFLCATARFVNLLDKTNFD